MTNALKVLHIAAWPGPPFSGGRINHHRILKRLAPRHRFRFIIDRVANETVEMTAEALAGMRIANEGVEIITRPPLSIARRLRGLVSSHLPPGIAYLEQVAGQAMRRAVEVTVRDWRPDALMIWSPNWASVFHDCAPGLRKVIYACDSMSMLNRSLAVNSRNLIRKLYNSEVARRYSFYERAYYPAYDEVVFVGARDAAYVGLPPSVSVSVICNGVDIETLRPEPRTVGMEGCPRVVFHGNFGYVANVAAASYLAEQVGLLLKRELGLSGFEIRIIGGMDRKMKARLGRKPWVRLAGYVDDLGTELNAGTVYAAPITMGAGVKTKVLEAMACGLAVVGTPEAFASIAIEPGIHAVICSLDRIASEVMALLRDPPRRVALGKAARDWLVRHASWDGVAERYEALWRPPDSSVVATTRSSKRL